MLAIKLFINIGALPLVSIRTLMFKEFLVSFISKFYLKGGWGSTTPKFVVFLHFLTAYFIKGTTAGHIIGLT